MLFLCQHKCIVLFFYLGDILVLIHSKHAGKRAKSFLCSVMFCLGLCISFFQVLTLTKSTLSFLGLFWDAVGVSIFLPIKIQQLTLSLLQMQSVIVFQDMTCMDKALFVPNYMYNFAAFVSCNSEQYVDHLSFLYWLNLNLSLFFLALHQLLRLSQL